MRRIATLALAAVALLMAPAAPAAAAETAAGADAASTSCTVADGQLTWGFKESFRSYISGTIANGSWEPIAPATYATPTFTWPADGGTFQPETRGGEVVFSGDISFAGGVHFTGHDGLLDTTIAEPTLSFPGDGTATLLLDLRSVSMEDALAGETDAASVAEQAPFVTVDLAASPMVVEGGGASVTVSGSAVPTAITAEGFDAFGSYEAGTAFDPLDFTVTLECVAASAEPAPTTTPAQTPADEPSATATPAPAPSAIATWIAWPAAAVAILLIALVVWLVLRRRRAAGGSDR